MRNGWFLVGALVLLRSMASPVSAQESPAAALEAAQPMSGKTADVAELVVTSDTRLDPTKTYGRIRIAASQVVLDGAGVTLVGSADGKPRDFQGTAIVAEGVSQVTLRNLKARGWERGLRVRNGRQWTIEDCDFSDNFHDPDFGWGENGRRGGILLEGVHDSVVRRVRANRVWDGCVLVDCDRNTIEDNDFSHTSNTCLKMWHASENVVRRNRLAYGLRISPGEVHARDSTCVLMESGSNGNRFEGNDCTHGGDGIFIRVLNQWVSTDNTFVDNDCSYANNNCIEAWSPRNTWIRNKANHGSYGFWLGASDQNVLVENEASFNGLPNGFHNSPHLPEGTHAGIVFMFGPSSHTVLRGNRCEGNHGAGIAAIGDLESQGRKWNAFHWGVEQNQLVGNRWGIYLQHAEMLTLRGNTYERNERADVWEAGDVRELDRRDELAVSGESPRIRLAGPHTVVVGESMTWRAECDGIQDRPRTWNWRVQSLAGVTTQGLDSEFTTTFARPGFHRLALTVEEEGRLGLAWRDVYAVESLPELGTEPVDGDVSAWTCMEADSDASFAGVEQVCLQGRRALRARIDPYGGGRVTLRWQSPGVGASTAGKTHLVFWVKARNEHVPGWQGPNPVVGLGGADGSVCRFTPTQELLSSPAFTEAREGWMRLEVPLAGDAIWQREGSVPETLAAIECGFDSWGTPPLTLWLDGMGLVTCDPANP